MGTFKVTIARILTDYPAKVFTVQAPDIILAQKRVWRKVKTWHHVIAAEQCVERTALRNEPIAREWDTPEEDEAWANL